MGRFFLYFNSRGCVLAALLSFVAAVAGCAVFDRERWNLDRYRDERAVEIDRRLEQTAPAVENPF